MCLEKKGGGDQFGLKLSSTGNNAITLGIYKFIFYSCVVDPLQSWVYIACLHISRTIQRKIVCVNNKFLISILMCVSLPSFLILWY